MKAIVSNVAGGPDTLSLETLATPNIGADEVLLSVRACGVNYPDLLIIRDLYQIKPPRPFIPGTEVSGVVEKLGEGVDTLRLGDRVIGFSTHGGMAEQVAIPAKDCVPIPDDMPFDDAAVFLTTFGTSYYALKNRGSLARGETLLVLGAAGGTGIAAVEIGKALGAKVVGAVSSEKKAAFVLSRGADHCVVYPKGPFDGQAKKDLAALFKQACGAAGANVIYDPVGGDYTEASLRSIARGGRFLVVGFAAGIAKLPLNLPLLKSCQVVGVFYDTFTKSEPRTNLENTDELLKMYRNGTIKPEVSAQFRLEDAKDAFKMLEAREAVGKIALSMS